MTTSRARTLRRNATDSEKALWALLRSRQLAGLKFRRQQPLGPYIVDFVCFQLRLIVEADGGQHAEQQADYDNRRTAWLQAQGFRVLRFWNNDILENSEGLYDEIVRAAIAPSPSPALPRPQGAREGGT